MVGINFFDIKECGKRPLYQKLPLHFLYSYGHRTANWNLKGYISANSLCLCLWIAAVHVRHINTVSLIL